MPGGAAASQPRAERAMIVRATLQKAEKGNPSVSMGTYATLLFILRLTGRLADLADARFDTTGLALEASKRQIRIAWRRLSQPESGARVIIRKQP